ncbi:MAG: hypothetical protein ABW007_10050 [Chitinophagaceae bacterium]
MRQPTQKTSRYAHLTRLILAAICVGVFCAPQTLADSGSRLTLASFGAEDSSDFRRDGESGEYISWRHSKTAPAFPAGFGTMTASRAPAQSSCAPHYDCFGFYPVCWYELLNSEWNTSCTRKWVFPNGYQPEVGDRCTLDAMPDSSLLVVLPDAGTFYQDFSVPSDATGPLYLDVWFQTLGGGTHWDRIYVELYEGNTRLGLYRFPSANNCNGGSWTFSGNYAGKNLRLKVTGSIVTPGVVHRVEGIRLQTELP